ncbi:hypothetical protein AKJ16_DCAP18562 [Drosera capensis]
MVRIVQQVGSGVTSVLTAGAQNSLNMGVMTLHSAAIVVGVADVTVATIATHAKITKADPHKERLAIVWRTQKAVFEKRKNSDSMLVFGWSKGQAKIVGAR